MLRKLVPASLARIVAHWPPLGISMTTNESSLSMAVSTAFLMANAVAEVSISHVMSKLLAGRPPPVDIFARSQLSSGPHASTGASGPGSPPTAATANLRK